MYRETESGLLVPEQEPLISGRFGFATDYTVRKFRGDQLVDTYKAKNIIVNKMFDAMLSGANCNIRGVIYGAGNSTPLETDTALQSYLGGGNTFISTNVTKNTTVAPRSTTRSCVVQTAEGAVVGNVAELAMYYGATTTAPSNSVNIATRARVVDELGAPTTIPVAADEYLQTTFNWTMYFMDGVTGSFNINLLGTLTPFDYEIRPMAMNNAGYPTSSWSSTGGTADNSVVPIVNAGSAGNMEYSGSTNSATWIDPTASTALNAQANRFDTMVSSTYVPGSKVRRFTPRLGLTRGNFAAPGIRGFYLSFGNWAMHQVMLDGPFVKASNHVFDFPFDVSLGNVP